MIQPPSNNMGAHITSAPVTAPIDNQILIDFLAWTLKVNCPDDAINLSGLNFLTFVDCKGGGMGYKSSKRCGNIVVFYDGSEGMGCHISMTGQGCRQYEAYKKINHCWYDLLHTLVSVGANFTRLDIANDNVDGCLDLDRLEDVINRKQVRTLFKRGHKHSNFSFTEKDDNGRTIYVGSDSSRLKIRFYDKAAQYDLNSHWVRCEIQLRSERASEAIKHLLKNTEIGVLFVSVLNSYFTVINLDDSNKSRCSTQDWWSAWLHITDKLKLTTMKSILLVEETMEHIKKQYAASLAMIKKYLGVVGFHEFVHQVVGFGQTRLTRKHDFIIQSSNLVLDVPF